MVDECGTDFACYVPYIFCFAVFGGIVILKLLLFLKLKPIQNQIVQREAEIEELRDENEKLKLQIANASIVEEGTETA